MKLKFTMENIIIGICAVGVLLYTGLYLISLYLGPQEEPTSKEIIEANRKLIEEALNSSTEK